MIQGRAQNDSGTQKEVYSRKYSEGSSQKEGLRLSKILGDNWKGLVGLLKDSRVL